MTPSTPDQPVCENKLQDVLKIFVYKHTADGWTKIENVNLNKLYDDSKANPTEQKAKNAGTEYHTYTTAVIPAGENAICPRDICQKPWTISIRGNTIMGY